ncbi:MAG TPA: autotransporter outer membrane beta-barrel domain-containing protein [Sphingomicrobium sp.]|nr:autotransporter outer membrane beta-barrel domain-containing protein [Sphingomicrobium sp.]
MNKVLRTALTGSALATGMMLAASPAQAACTLAGGVLTCTNTTTVDTQYPTNVATGTDRSYSDVGVESTIVGSGVVVDGFGLAIADSTGNTFLVTNNGTIQVNAGNTPLAQFGGQGALNLATNADAITYSGSGDILNLGTGEGFFAHLFFGGSLAATFGGSVQANAGDAIEVVADDPTTGAITITTTAGETIRASGGSGIDVTTAGSGAVTITNAANISSAGALGTLEDGIVVVDSGTGAVTVTNSGSIGSPTDRATDDGINAAITNAASTANVTITNGAGAVYATDYGIEGSTAGTGNVSVTTGAGTVNTLGIRGVSADPTSGNATVVIGTGGVTATGAAAAAVFTDTTVGATSITVNGAVSAPTAGSAGIAAYSTTGTQTMTVNAAVSGALAGIYSVGNGTRTINIGTAGVVTGTGSAIQLFGAGTTTINNGGRIGAASTDLALLNSGTAAVTLNNGSATNSTAILNGRLTLAGGADTVTNRAVWNTQGTTDFGAGADTLTNGAGGVINILANTTFANLETFNQTGRINFTAGTTLTGPAIAFVNGPGSFIDTAGAATIAGFTSMSNAGTIDLAAGTFTVPAGLFTNAATGIIIADEGATTITGQTSFTNDGILDLLDGVRDDVLTINSAYSGTGDPTARLQVDVSGTTADLLVVNGNVTGATFIDVNTIGLGVFDPDGILVVDVTGAFTSTAGAFIIGEESGNPLINYDVARIGQDFYLVTLLDPETAFVPLASTGLIREMWYQSADEVFAHTLAPTAKVGLSVWGTAYGSQRRTGQTNEQFVNGVQYDADNNIEIDRYGFQAGVGYGFGMAEVGLTGGYANAQANGDGEFDADGWNIGLYGRFGGLTGFHAEALFKHDAYDVSFDGLFDGNDVDASSTGVDGSIGYRMAMGVVPSIDFHAGVSHVWSDMDDVSAFGFGYEFDDMTSTRGRLGVRGNFGGLYNPYLGATAYHEFSGDGDVTITNGAFSSGLSSSGKGTWVRLEGGLAGGASMYGVNVAGWVDFGDTRGAGIRAGFRF